MIGRNISAKIIQYFDGLNSLVASNIAKKEELMHAENARATMIGTIEKREGMEVIGTAAAGATFTTTANKGLFYFNNTFNKGLYRVSEVNDITGACQIYYLNNSSVWTALTGTYMPYIPTSLVSTCVAEGDLYIVNKGVLPSYILGTNGTTVTLSTSATGNLYRCPKAGIVNYYKGRLYVADYLYGSPEISYPNSVLMSSMQLGVLALVNNDVSIGETVIPVTDNKYFIDGETVEFRRGNGPAIATGVVSSVQEVTITLSAPTSVKIEAADEIWVNGTFSGKKVFRWVANPSSIGVDAKEYDTFKVSSTTDNNDETIRVMTNVGNVMFISTKNNIAIWNSYVLQNLDFGIGCCSKTGHVKMGGLLYFLHYTGVYSTEGGAPKHISGKVERYIRGATKSGLEAAVAGKKGRSVFFAIGDVTLKNPDGSLEKVLNDVCLEYNAYQENWYVHTNWGVSRAVTFISDEDPDRLVALSGIDGNPVVELLASGTASDVGDAGGKRVEIPFRIDTPNILLGNSFQFNSQPTEIDVEMERGSGMKCFISLDMDKWYELEGEARKGLTIFKVNSVNGDVATPPKCRNMRISLRHNSAQLCKVSKIAILSIPTAEEQVDHSE
jgi:hypothetical protein